MKTKPMAHQLEALRRLQGRDAYALFMEQGTGKTWTLLADAERLYAAGRIDGVLVVAPKGVHLNWINREIPTHLNAPTVAAAWRSGANRKQLAALERLFEPREEGEIPPLRVLAVNIEALITDAGYAMARRFLGAVRAMMIVDESSRIKNPDARRTKNVMSLRPFAEYARVATGTPITNAPVDVFAQMEFLESGLLGTTSYRAFVAEYAELVPAGHPLMRQLAQRNPRAAAAQIIARNEDGSPRWRNLDRLQQLLEPHSFRVLKRDCLDLPEKIYKTHYFEMSSAQSRAYRLMREELRLELEGEAALVVTQLGSMIKLQQITSNFAIPPGGGSPIYISEDNPRLAALLGLFEDIEGSVIVWARFREELAAIARALRAAKIEFVEYHGGISQPAREEAVDKFQSGRAQVFLGQPQSGGIGLTLTAAETVVYFSNDFNLETRLQSEDRAHRIGTRRNVLYIDIVAEGTLDEAIARALQRKTNVAAAILGDLASGEIER